ncbi:MAG: M23 family metallopeptidase [Acidobacteria bacterium]|nr:M23 family metallopeptidase [Acidobacteriota bacterium]
MDNPRVTSGYGSRDGAMHHGLDIAAAEGTPIKASASGKVIYSGNGLRGYGNLIIVDHGDDYRTIYAHNRSNRVSVGQQVRQGEVIGYVGRTGRATAPHCHFEIRRKTTPLNPTLFLP